MKVNLSQIRQKAVPVDQYIARIYEPFRDRFIEREKTYLLKTEVVDKLRYFAGNYTIIAFSAEWCKDCAANVPVLALLAEAIGLEVIIFGDLKKDPLSSKRKWIIPPSPPGVERFQVDKIPLILVFDKVGVEVGRIVENPKEGLALEEEILNIILNHVKSA